MTKKSIDHVMTHAYITLSPKDTVKYAMKEWKKLEKPSAISEIIYVIDNEMHMIGFVDLRELFIEKPNTRISEIMQTKFLHVKEHQPLSAAVAIVVENKLSEIPVLDAENRLVGIILSEHLLDEVDWMHKRNILRISGILESEERVPINAHTIFSIIKKRIPWLIAAVFGGFFLAGSVINNFTEAIVEIPILAVFIPVLMNIGGGMGTQTAAAFMRTLADKDSEGMRQIPRQLVLNVIAGLITGFLLGLIVAALSMIFFNDTHLAIVLLMSFSIIGCTGVLVGFAVPAIASVMGKDPTSSTPLITMIKDATTLLIYFTLISILYL